MKGFTHQSRQRHDRQFKAEPDTPMLYVILRNDLEIKRPRPATAEPDRFAADFAGPAPPIWMKPLALSRAA
jgi:hypothetical protein